MRTPSVLNDSVVLLLVLMVTASASFGQARPDGLRRRGYFGAQVDPIPDTLRAKLPLHSGGGALVTRVSAGGPAQAAGVAANDVILDVGGTDVTDPRQFVSLVRAYRAGDRFRMTLMRDGKRLSKEVVARPLPPEADPAFDVLYESVVADGRRLRTIVTRPRGAGKHPAVLLIGGLGCYSLDGIGEGNAYGKILHALTRQGVATMRVEKSGMGDSEGPPCSSPQADLRAEVAGFAAGLRALKAHAFVDSGAVFVFGHSMGGIVAPLVVGQVPVRGVVVAGTIGTGILEHELANLRRQLVLRGTDYGEVDALVRQKAACNHRLYVERQTPDQIGRDAPGCAKLPIQPAAPYTYMQQAAGLSLGAAWKGSAAPVLVLYGTSDYRTSAQEHQYLADMLNSFRPGRATFVQIEGMDHGFARAPSQRASLERTQGGQPQEVFHPQVLDEVQRWMKNPPNAVVGQRR